MSYTTFGRVVVANLVDSFAHNLLIVDYCLGVDFTQYHDHSGLGGCLCNKTTGSFVPQM